MRSRTSGNALIWVLASTFIMTLSAYFAFTKAGLVAKSQKRGQLALTREIVGGNVRAILDHYPAWRGTVDARGNGGFGCLREQRLCDPAPLPVQLLDASGTVYLDLPEADAGFDRLGARCTGFPSDGCPVKAAATWTPICSGDGGCRDPQIRLEVRFTFAERGKDGMRTFGSPHRLELEQYNPLSAQGFTRLGNGAWLQWGTARADGIAVPFPVPALFTAPPTVFVSGENGGPAEPTEKVTASGLTIRAAETPERKSAPLVYLAVGG